MSGLLRPFAARRLVKALRDEVALPIHLHTHDTAGIQAGSYLFAAEAGVDVVDCAFGAMSSLTSQPNLETMVAALEHQERDTGLPFDRLLDFTYYWEEVRNYYAAFESGLKAPSADVYIHEIPGGQYSNLRPQAESVGVGDRIPELKRMYAVVNEMLGDIVKVTPSSKMVGDLALFMLTNNLTPQDLLDRGARSDLPRVGHRLLRRRHRPAPGRLSHPAAGGGAQGAQAADRPGRRHHARRRLRRHPPPARAEDRPPGQRPGPAVAT